MITKVTPQQEFILDILRDKQWHCQTEWLGRIKDDRKRISELNAGYMKEKGYFINGKRCDGRCGKNHSSNLYMRRAERIQEKLSFSILGVMDEYWNSLSTTS